MAGSKEMEIAIKIAGKVESSFSNALGQATKGIGSITKAVAGATVAAAAAVGGMGIAAINVGKEFEKSMSQVAATMLIDKSTDAGRKSFETLENAARECGRNTAFSATEASEALNYLALAGYDAEKAAKALPTVLNLAGAGAMSLGQASDMVTDSMSALGIAATEANLTGFADKLAMTASKSNTSVSQLGEAILTVGGTAQGLAGGTTELNAALGVLADSGMKASEGGTHLRNMILSLQNPRNKDAAKLFEKMGLSAYDAQGNMRNLGEVFGDLNVAMQGASAQEVNNTLSTMFKQTDLAAARAMLAATSNSVESLETVMNSALSGSGTSVAALGMNLQELADGFNVAATQEEFAAQMMNQFGLTAEEAAMLHSGLQSVVGETGTRFEELSAAVEDSAGACEDMYATQLDNLEGDLDILKSGLADLGIGFYKDVNGPLRDTAQFATELVGRLAEAYGEGGLEGMVEAVGDCLGDVVIEMSNALPRIVEVGINLIRNLLRGISDNSGIIASSAAEVLSVFIDGLFTLVPEVILAGIDIVVQLVDSITSQLPQLINNGTQAIVNYVSGIIKRLPSIISTALTLVQTLVSSLGTHAPMLISSAIQLIGSLILGIVQMLPSLIQMGIELIMNLAQGIMSNLPLILQMATEIILNLVSGIAQMLPTIIQSGIQLIISLIQGIISNLGNIIQSAVQIVLALATGLIQAIPQLIAAVPQLITAIIECILSTNWLEVGIEIVKGIINGLVSMGASLWETIKALFTGGELPEIQSAGVDMGASYVQGVESSASSLADATELLSAGAFMNVDLSGAQTAGLGAGAAFGEGITDGMSDFALDTESFIDTASLTEIMSGAGLEGIGALSDGMSSNGVLAVNAMSELGSNMETSMDSSWNSLQSSTKTAMDNITQTVKTAAQAAASAVKAAFENLTIKIPKPQIPVINVVYKTESYGNGGSVKLPKFDVAWNALGGIFTRPTILGSSAGAQGVGEAGSEAILPLDTLWTKMRGIVEDTVKQNSGTSVIDALITKLKGFASGSNMNRLEFAGSGGPSITYSPIYNLYGNASRQDMAEADKISQAEFNKMIRQWEKDNNRTKF